LAVSFNILLYHENASSMPSIVSHEQADGWTVQAEQALSGVVDMRNN
jgi:hypothetical protein